MESLPTRYPIGDSVTTASHFLYGLPFPFASASTHPNHGCTLCSDCLIPGRLVCDYVMEVWDPPDNINLGMMCSARVTGRCTVQSLLLLGWKDLERLQFLYHSIILTLSVGITIIDIFKMELGSIDHSLPT